jgi:glycine dehydrogenase subunit 1
MAFTCGTDGDREEMLRTIGVKSVDELFSDIPGAMRFAGRLNLPQALSEQEAARLVDGIAARNRLCVSFAGAGAYNHYVPAAVDALASRSEFYTAYTPYQPEVSQGTLTAIFEFQTMIALLTGMDIANASLYDGATALAEAVLLSVRTSGRKSVLVSRAVHPHYREVLRTYAWANDLEIRDFPVPDGTAGGEPAWQVLDDRTAALVVQNPNFFGCIEDIEACAKSAHEKGALLIALVTEPVSMGLLKPPGACGADIACGEASGLGNYMGFGGPALGFMAVRRDFMRDLPGRLVGKSVDVEGREAYVLTLQTREQHIRRERATSNICTNQGLCALRTVIYLSLLGPRLRELAELNHRLASYCSGLLAHKGYRLLFNRPFFNEIALNIPDPVDIIDRLSAKGIGGGIALKSYYPEYPEAMLICCTEMNTPSDIETLASIL